MKRNRVPFQKGLSLLALMRQYRTATQCLGRRRGSLAAGLLLSRLRQLLPLPPADPSAVAVPSLSTAGVPKRHGRRFLRLWKADADARFLAIHLLTQARHGLSSLEQGHLLGVSQNMAWKIKHKLLQTMKNREERTALQCLVQVDDTRWDGKRRSGRREWGAPGKTSFAAAVQVSAEGQPERMHLSSVLAFHKRTLVAWAAATWLPVRRCNRTAWPTSVRHRGGLVPPANRDREQPRARHPD